MAPKFIIFKLMKPSLHRNYLLLKPKKYNHFAKEEENPVSIPFTLILPILLYSCKRIATISSLKRLIKKKLQD